MGSRMRKVEDDWRGTARCQMSRYADLIAERAGALGGVAQGTVQTAADCSPLRPYPLGVADVTAHVCAVAEVLAAFGASVRGAIEQAAVFEDADAADVFVELPRGDSRRLRRNSPGCR